MKIIEILESLSEEPSEPKSFGDPYVSDEQWASADAKSSERQGLAQHNIEMAAKLNGVTLTTHDRNHRYSGIANDFPVFKAAIQAVFTWGDEQLSVNINGEEVGSPDGRSSTEAQEVRFDAAGNQQLNGASVVGLRVKNSSLLLKFGLSDTGTPTLVSVNMPSDGISYSDFKDIGVANTYFKAFANLKKLVERNPETTFVPYVSS